MSFNKTINNYNIQVIIQNRKKENSYFLNKNESTRNILFRI